jgi:hydroxymethylpyrimidine/phosphomethylpyrimidine kinase
MPGDSNPGLPPVLPSPAPPPVVVFAASDPTGGAGLQADVLTVAARGGLPLSVLTGITVQDTSGVAELRALEPDLVERQARTLLADIRPAAFKLGVLASAANARVVARVLKDYPEAAIVVDPVLASGRGDPLADPALVTALKEIFPFTTVLTPNSVEARRLAGRDDLASSAAALLGMGCRYVLVTGTHEIGAEVVNTLYDARGAVRADRWPRLPGDYHGSGCALASALAAALARGMDVADAVHDAQGYTWKALEQAFRAGAGQLLPNRMWSRQA